MREREFPGMTTDIQAPTTHAGILTWVTEIAELTQPDRIHWCTGSDEEWTELTDALLATGTFTKLDESKKPNPSICSLYPIERPASTASTSPRNRRTCGSPSASPGSSPPSTRSSAVGRTSCSSPGCGTSRTRARSRTTCWRRFSLTDAAARQGVDVFGWHAPPAGHRDEPHRELAGDLPGRADRRARPRGTHRGVADGQGARRPRHDGAAHHAVPGRGRAAGRPDRDPAPGPDHRERHPRRAQAAPPARQGRVRREAADPGGDLPRGHRGIDKSDVTGTTTREQG